MPDELNDKIALRLDSLTRNIEHLRELAAHDLEEFLGSFESRYAARYLLRESIDIVIDICHRIIALENLAVPQTYVEAVGTAAEAGAVPRELLPRLRSMVRFRDLVMHQYQEVDDRRVYEVLRDHVDDFELFARAVYQWGSQSAEAGTSSGARPDGGL